MEYPWLLYVIPVLICFYIIYIIRFRIYKKNSDKKIKFPLYAYIFMCILSLCPIINIILIIGFTGYVITWYDEIDIKSKLFKEF